MGNFERQIRETGDAWGASIRAEVEKKTMDLEERTENFRKAATKLDDAIIALRKAKAEYIAAGEAMGQTEEAIKESIDNKLKTAEKKLPFEDTPSEESIPSFGKFGSKEPIGPNTTEKASKIDYEHILQTADRPTQTAATEPPVPDNIASRLEALDEE